MLIRPAQSRRESRKQVALLLARFCSIALPLFLLATEAVAQPRTPHIGYVYPAGGRVDTDFRVMVGGQYLAGVTNGFVSNDGMRIRFVEYNRPLTQNEFNQLREELQSLREKRTSARDRSSTNVWTAVDEKRFNEIRARILKNPPNRQGNPALAETVTLMIEVLTNAVPRERELRLQTPDSLSNPLKFCIGTLPEFGKPAAAIVTPEIERLRQQYGAVAPGSLTNSPLNVTLPAVANGQILPGEVDRVRFTARKGQELVIAAQARALMPYLADAVPGWFQAALALHDAKGREVAYDDDFRFHPDPVLHYRIPESGEYTVEIMDAIYRGREDFVYRIAIGELPFITSIYPLGAKAGAATAVELSGWNLPTNRMLLQFDTPGVKWVSVTNGNHLSNLVPFEVNALPEIREKEPNDQRETAQAVSLPVIINGRINHPDDWDVFRIQGKAGEEIVAEVSARRLDSSLDSILKLTDANGRQIALNDDCEDKSSGLNTHHADSCLQATLPSDGPYFLWLGDTQHKGGEEYAYRLRVSAPRPDFALRVTPSAVNARPGASTTVTVFAVRKDGLTNAIRVALANAPPGFKLSTGTISGTNEQVRLNLTAPWRSPAGPVHVEIEGRAFVDGKTITHAALPAEDMMQAFAYRHLVPAGDFFVTVGVPPRTGKK